MESKKVIFNIEGKKFTIALPKELSLREQSKDCSSKGHLCALFNNQKCCLKPKIEDVNGSLSVFEMENCSKNPEKRGLRI